MQVLQAKVVARYCGSLSEGPRKERSRRVKTQFGLRMKQRCNMRCDYLNSRLTISAASSRTYSATRSGSSFMSRRVSRSSALPTTKTAANRYSHQSQKAARNMEPSPNLEIGKHGRGQHTKIADARICGAIMSCGKAPHARDGMGAYADRPLTRQICTVSD